MTNDQKNDSASNTTARKAADENGAVETSKRQLAAVMSDDESIVGISRVKVAMVLTDPRVKDNPIVYVNETFEKTTGYDRSAAIGRNCRFLQGEKTDKSEVDKIRHAIENGKDTSVDILNYRADGKPFMNRLTIAPIFADDGTIMYYLGIQKELYDTERREAATQKLLTDIRARVEDDLSMILKGLNRPDASLPIDFEAMSRRMECLQLVYESLQLSDSQGTRSRGIDLGALISRVAAGIAHEEGRPGIRYQQYIEGASVNLESAVRIALLLSEVLSNAFHHAFDRLEEGLIEMRLTRLPAGGLRLVVSDDGLGLPRNVPFPDMASIGGRLLMTLADGLDATITPVRGAAGTVVILDVPAGVIDV